MRNREPDSDSEEYRRTVDELRKRVERIARRMVRRGTETDDILQEALLSTIRYARERPNPPENLDGFLFYRIRYVIKEMVRGVHGEAQLDESQIRALIDVIVRPTAALEEQDQQKALEECVTELTDARASVWHRTYVAKMDAGEAAQDLGITVNALRVRLHHARATIVECLTRKGVLEP